MGGGGGKGWDRRREGIEGGEEGGEGDEERGGGGRGIGLWWK